MRTTDFRVLLRQEAVGSELHLFVCLEEDLGNQMVAQEMGYTSIEAEDAMRSHNHCVFVCKIFAGILAWWTEELGLPITVDEVDLSDISEPKPVICIDVINGERRRVASVHTMFKVLCSDAYPEPDGLVEKEGLYIDASAPQYLRPAGVYAVHSYPARPQSSTRLGGAYKTHLRKLHEVGTWRNYKLEAIVRTINNEMYTNMIRLGGPGILVDRDVAKWTGFEREILASIKSSLQSLVAKLNLIYIPVPDSETHYKLIARDCLGIGHKKIIESLERVSGGVEIALLQDI
ncbi:hypothetical protein G6011_11302 [Alternaria panax]|uniref:Uncharacterized protein n=1 Tax=Alternaria panax TaxID=48097 RepID=A0AAD4IDK5_9PLEO|nr:hypothetical protein G6011_11302 [Alternaria panax]